MSMIGETLEIYEIDAYDQAWVTKEWWLSEDDVMSHSIGLRNHECEVQNNQN